MLESEVLSGKWDELARVYGPELLGRQVEIRVLPTKAEKATKMITLGMFPGLAGLTEEDFKSAEWRTPSEGEF